MLPLSKFKMIRPTGESLSHHLELTFHKVLANTPNESATLPFLTTSSEPEVATFLISSPSGMAAPSGSPEQAQRDDRQGFHLFEALLDCCW